MTTKYLLPDSVLKSHLVVLGKTGAGKSSVLRGIVERLLEQKKRVAVVDIKGDWWGLKSSADGRSAGYPVIAFGDFREPKAQDVPINSKSGKHVAELIAGGNRPALIGFRGWLTSDITDFWLDFAQTLFNRNEGELYVVISECHNFAPKGKVLDPKAGRVLHWTNRLLSEGRGLGMTFLLDSQRPQKVHNDVLTSCETLVAMRVVHKADRDALAEWVKGCGDMAAGSKLLNEVAGLKRGEAIVWSPESEFGPTRMQFPMFKTFDSFAPVQVQKTVSQSGWAEVDLEAVKAKLAAVIEEAKGNDPAELKKQIAEMRRELKAAQAGKTFVGDRVSEAMTAELTKSEERNTQLFTHIMDAETRHTEFVKTIDGVVDRVAAEIAQSIKGTLKKAFSDVCHALMPAPLKKFIKMPARVIVGRGNNFVPPGKYQALPMKTPDIHIGNNSDPLTNPQRAILRSLMEWHVIGIKQPSREQVAFLAGYSPNGTAFTNPLGSLRTLALIHYPKPGAVELTREGIHIAPQVPYEAVITTEAIYQRICARLTGPQQRIFAAIYKAHPAALTREETADRTDPPYSPNGTAFTNPLGSLRTLGLIEYPAQGQVKAADWMFV